MEPMGAWTIGKRQMNAVDSFVDSVMDQFGFSQDEARKIWEVYFKNRIVKTDATMGQYKLADGRFWDKEVMRRALEQGA